MYYTGFADEAGDSIDTQIRATQALGWQYIEARNIDGVNMTDISDREFKTIRAKLDEAGIRINCFGSAVANWGKDPRRKVDFQASMAELKRAIPRMKILGTRMLRGMSFKLIKDRPPDDPEIERLVFRQLRQLVRLCEASDILYLHENCMTYGGQSYAHTLKLIEAVGSEAFRLVFDTGNPVFSDHRVGKPPYTKQDAWNFYTQVRPYIAYIHIKDGRFLSETDELFPEVRYTYPGEGDGDVRKILTDLIRHGYDGGLSIEPHMQQVAHEAGDGKQSDRRFDTYVEYGRRLTQLVDEVRQELKSGASPQI